MGVDGFLFVRDVENLGGIVIQTPCESPILWGTMKKAGGHPQFPRQRVIPLDFPTLNDVCLKQDLGDTPKTPTERILQGSYAVFPPYHFQSIFGGFADPRVLEF